MKSVCGLMKDTSLCMENTPQLNSPEVESLSLMEEDKLKNVETRLDGKVILYDFVKGDQVRIRNPWRYSGSTWVNALPGPKPGDIVTVVDVSENQAKDFPEYDPVWIRHRSGIYATFRINLAKI